MPSFIPDSSSFADIMALTRRNFLKSNLDALSVPVKDQQKIVQMRDNLPPAYHEIPLNQPSNCFFLFENFRVPEKKTLFNCHRVEKFEQCKERLLGAANQL